MVIPPELIEPLQFLITAIGVAIIIWMIAGDVLKQIDDIPSAEPERKKGELETVGFLTCQCSECGAQFHELEYTNFCPNCGAKWSK